MSCGIYLFTTVIALTRGWSLRDTSSSEKSWMSKVRTWFLKVVLSNTFRAPLGPCARCEGVDLHATICTGSRVCKVCSSTGTEEVDFTTESQPLPRSLKPRVLTHILEISDLGGTVSSPHEGIGSFTETVGDMVTEWTLIEDARCEANILRVADPGQTVRNFGPMKDTDDGKIGALVPTEQAVLQDGSRMQSRRQHQGTVKDPQIFWSELESLNRECDGPGRKVSSVSL